MSVQRLAGRRSGRLRKAGAIRTQKPRQFDTGRGVLWVVHAAQRYAALIVPDSRYNRTAGRNVVTRMANERPTVAGHGGEVARNSQPPVTVATKS